MHTKKIIKNVFLYDKNDFLISESRKIFPKLSEDFIKKNKQLLFNLIQSHKLAKRNYHIISLNENIQRKKFLKESLLINYYRFVLLESQSPEHFGKRLDETFFVLFKKDYNIKTKLLNEYKKYKLRTRNIIFEDNKRPKFDPHKDLDHKNANENDPSTVAYWKLVAQKEPNAEDIQLFIKFMKYYEKGYNPFKIYSIPENEPGGNKTYKPAIQQKLYNRYIFKKKLVDAGSSEEEIREKLKKFDKENAIEEYTSSEGEKEQPKEEEGFFTKLIKKTKKTASGSVGFILGSSEKKKEIIDASKEVPQEKQKSWYEKIKEFVNKVLELYNNPKWKPIFQGAFRTVGYIVLMWVLGIIASSLGPWGALLLAIVKAVISAITIFKGVKELYKKIEELKGGESGIKGLINIAKNIIKPENLLFVIIRVISIAFAVWGLIGALQSAYKAAKEILENMGYTSQQIQAAADGDPPNQGKGGGKPSSSDGLSPEAKNELYKGINTKDTVDLNLEGAPQEQIQKAMRALNSNKEIIKDINRLSENIINAGELNLASERELTQRATSFIYSKYFISNIDPDVLQSPAREVIGPAAKGFSGSVADYLKSVIEHQISQEVMDRLW